MPEADDGGQDQHDRGGDQIVLVAVREARDGDAGLVHHVREVRRPADGDRTGSESQLEDQVPADDPGDQLAEARVRERVRRAGHRHGAGELRVAQRGEGADDAGEDEGQGDGRSGLGTGRFAGQDEDAGADHDPDAEHRELEGPSSLRSWWSGSSVSAIDCSMVLVRKGSWAPFAQMADQLSDPVRATRPYPVSIISKLTDESPGACHSVVWSPWVIHHSVNSRQRPASSSRMTQELL